MSHKKGSAFGRLPAGARLERIRRSPQYRGDRFCNPIERTTRPGLGMALRLLPRWVFGREERTPRRPLPVHGLEPASLAVSPATWRATWLGHSTCLLEFGRTRILTDPVWSARVSPLRFAGPTRFHSPPVALSDLPPLDVVLISHDHYDHLDMDTVRALASRDTRFVVALGVGEHLESWGLSAERIVELDWWEHCTLPGGVDITATPAHHLSGRNAVTGRDATLWASFVIRHGPTALFFGGDAGQPTDFDSIGRRFGPFDLTILPIGAYGEHWPDIHLTPEEAVAACAALGGKLLLPIHWGTFNLAFHAWHEPPERLLSASGPAGIAVALPLPGQPVTPDHLPPVSRWWEL